MPLLYAFISCHLRLLQGYNWKVRKEVKLFTLKENEFSLLYGNCTLLHVIITGPPTHSVGGQTSNGRWHLSLLSVVCNMTHMQCNSPGDSMQQASRVMSC